MTVNIYLSEYQLKKLRCSCNKGEICTIQIHEDQIGSQGIPLPISNTDLKKIDDNGVANCKIDTLKIGDGIFDTINNAINKGKDLYQKGKKIYKQGKEYVDEGKKLVQKGKKFYKDNKSTIDKATNLVRRRRGRGGWETLIEDSKNAYDEYADQADHEYEEELKDSLRGNRRSLRARKRAIRGKGAYRPGNGAYRPGNGLKNLVGQDIINIAYNIVKAINAKHGRGAGDDEKINKVVEILNKAGNPANQAATTIASALGKYRMNKATRLENRLDRQKDRQKRILERVQTRVNRRKARQARRKKF